MESNNKISNLKFNEDMSQIGGIILDSSKLKRFRLQEYLVYNIFLLFFVLLVNGIDYTGLSIQSKSVIPIIFLLVLNIMRKKLKMLCFRFFKFLEYLEYYEHQKLIANKKKLGRSGPVITVILVSALIFVGIYPSPNLFSLQSIIVVLVGLNIGKFLSNHKIDNM